MPILGPMVTRPSILSASLKLLACAVCACGFGWTGEAAPADELSPAAKRAMASAEDAIAKARAAYLAAARKEQDKLLAALQREQETQTKAGKLEAALAVKAAADKVRSGDYQKELDERAANSDDLLGEKPAGAQGPPLARLAGHWRMQFSNDWRRMVRVEPDGRCTVVQSNHLGEGTVYTLRWDAKAAGFISEGLGNMLEVYRVNGETVACDHWCDRTKYGSEGPSLTALVEKMPPPPAGQQPQPPRR